MTTFNIVEENKVGSGILIRVKLEIALKEKRLKLLNSNPKGLAEIISKTNSDLATNLFYHYILKSKHALYIQHINQLPTHFQSNGSVKKILIIPGNFYAEYSDIGADGVLVKSVFEKNEFETEIINTISRGSVTENKEIIRQSILKNKHGQVWLVRISKGTADVRAYLQEIGAEKVPKFLKGWINLSGTYLGSILADHRTNSKIKKNIYGCFVYSQALNINW